MDQDGRTYNTHNLTPYQKGQSGNPSGKPKGIKSRKALAKRWMTATETAKNPITKEYEELSQEDLCFLSMIYAVRSKQDVKAFEAIMDARFGKQAEKKEKEPKRTEESFTPFSIVDPANQDEVIEIEIGAAK